MLVVNNVPETITRDQLGDMLARIGVTDLNRVSAVAINPTGVHVTMFAEHSKHGGKYMQGSEVAVHVIHVPIVG